MFDDADPLFIALVLDRQVGEGTKARTNIQSTKQQTIKRYTYKTSNTFKRQKMRRGARITKYKGIELKHWKANIAKGRTRIKRKEWKKDQKRNKKSKKQLQMEGACKKSK